jgi:hypothetical protein
MAILGKFLKQPDEVQDYDISFVDWLAAFPDTAVSHTVTVDTGITLGTTSLTGGIVKLWLSGGITGAAYKVTATIVTAGGRTKQDEIVVKVKEQ